MTNQFYESAKYLAEKNYFVFPTYGINGEGACTCENRAACTKPGKHPVIASWQAAATIDLGTIKKWSNKYPNANIAIATGKKSGLTVVDVDGHAGEESIRLLIEKHQALPETVEVETGSGGTHYYFTYHPEFKNSVRFLPGLDIRNDGGYVIAPNSNHRSGKKYQFRKSPDDAQLFPIPSFLLAEFKRALETSKNKALQGLLEEGERNDGLFETWITQWHRGRTEEEIWDGLVKDNERRCTPSLAERELKALHKSITSYSPELPAYDEDGRRNIFLGRDQLREVADLVAEELVSRNQQTETLFRNQNTLVQKYQAGDDILTRAMTPDLMLAELCRNINWYTERYRSLGPSEPSDKLIKLLLTGIDLAAFKNLKGVCHWPLIERSGQLVATRGYHPITERILSLPASFNLTVPEQPTDGEVRDAVNLLRGELLADFPFSDNASFANTMAAMLQLFCCDLIQPPYPLHFIQAPVAGTGKSLLVKVICHILFGKEPSPLTLGENDQETRKRLSGQLFSLASYVYLDNLPPKVHSHSLAAALTTGTWSDRLLATNVIKHVDVNALWMATGNNVAFSNELARRIVLVELDPTDESPSTRSGFRHPDLIKWVQENRERLIRANLTLIRNWFAKGQPEGKQTFGSYESYARVIGGVLGAAGIEGLLGNRTDDFLNQDDDSFFWNHVVQEWFKQYGEKPISAGMLLKEGLLDEEFINEFLTAGDRNTSLGMKLSQVKNRVFSGLKIVPAGRGEKGQARYRLKKISGNLKPFDTVY
jgi:hypothetical protein